MTEKQTQLITDLRRELLGLHKELLDYQIELFEKKHGRVKAGRAMFHIVSTETSFAWLRQLSDLIVGIDAVLDSQELSQKNFRALFVYTKKLLSPDAAGAKFSKEYQRAIQKRPEILIRHHQISVLLNKKPSSR